jgi:hypothetical protein
MLAVLNVALPVFLVIAAGLAAGRLKLATEGDSSALNRFVFRFGFPAALFALMSGASDLSDLDARVAMAYGAAAVAVLCASYVFARTVFALDGASAGAHAFASSAGNAVFLGLPIALGVEGWARPFVTLMLVEGVLVVTLGAALMSPAEERRQAPTGPRALAFLARPLSNPLVAAAIAGVAFAAFGFDLPAPIRSFLELLGRAAGPVALFSLGLFFAARPAPPTAESAPKIAAVALFKMALLPALSFALARLLGVDDRAYLGALALFTATPTAVSAFVMASQQGRYMGETAAAVAGTTLLSTVSVSGALLLFAP